MFLDQYSMSATDEDENIKHDPDDGYDEIFNCLS